MQIETPESVRLMAGFSVTELAEKAGIAPTTISNIERGRVKHLQHKTISKIANVLNRNDYALLALSVRKVAR